MYLHRAEAAALLRACPDLRLDISRADRMAGALAPGIQPRRQAAGRDDPQRGAKAGRPGQRGWEGFLDAVAKRLEQAPGRFDGGHTVGADRLFEDEIADEQPDPQLGWAGAHLVLVRAPWRGRDEEIAGHWAGDQIEDGRGVAHRAREHVLDDISEQPRAARWPQRRSTARGLQPDQATCAGRYADGAGTVVSM